MPAKRTCGSSGSGISFVAHQHQRRVAAVVDVAAGSTRAAPRSPCRDRCGRRRARTARGAGGGAGTRSPRRCEVRGQRLAARRRRLVVVGRRRAPSRRRGLAPRGRSTPQPTTSFDERADGELRRHEPPLDLGVPGDAGRQREHVPVDAQPDRRFVVRGRHEQALAAARLRCPSTVGAYRYVKKIRTSYCWWWRSRYSMSAGRPRPLLLQPLHLVVAACARC